MLDRALAGDRNSCERSEPTNGAGQLNHYSVACEPERNTEGGIVGVVVVVVDITDRKRSEEHIRLLLREVNHRVKNALSVVLAIAQQTKAPSQDEFVKRFSDRVQPLAASHDLLSRSEWRSIAASELLRVQLAHFEGLIGRRILFGGPPLNLSVARAQCIGMVVHELATNAAKHGALSNQGGLRKDRLGGQNAGGTKAVCDQLDRERWSTRRITGELRLRIDRDQEHG
jgi:HWE histidine kinase/PAS fold